MAKREYIQANKDWLEAKAKEEGVKALPKGIYYKVLSEGRSSSARLLPEGRKNQESAKPTVRSIITAHYTGKTIDGKQFDSSRGGVPLACRLCELSTDGFSDHARYIRVTPKLSNTHTETQPKLSGSYIGATYYL
ncbi:MAG: hypothetical protein IIT76_17215 [Prevotella sp.]|nr:hypothetical protein [Prevotella sp.]